MGATIYTPIQPTIPPMPKRTEKYKSVYGNINNANVVIVYGDVKGNINFCGDVIIINGNVNGNIMDADNVAGLLAERGGGKRWDGQQEQ